MYLDQRHSDFQFLKERRNIPLRNFVLFCLFHAVSQQQANISFAFVRIRFCAIVVFNIINGNVWFEKNAESFYFESFDHISYRLSQTYQISNFIQM